MSELKGEVKVWKEGFERIGEQRLGRIGDELKRVEALGCWLRGTRVRIRIVDGAAGVGRELVTGGGRALVGRWEGIEWALMRRLLSSEQVGKIQFSF